MTERERFYRLLAENFPQGVVFLFDADLRYTFVAGEGLDALGMSADDLEGEHAGVTLPEDRRQMLLDRYRDALDGEPGRFEIESRGRRFQVRVLPLGDDERAGMGIAQDVTERRRVERELRATAESIRDLYQTASDPDRTFEEKLPAILEIGRDYLDLPYAFLTRIEGDTQMVVESRGDHDLLRPGETCPLEEAYCRRTIEREELLTVVDAVEEGWEGDPAYERFGLGTYAGAKVLVDDGLYGTICFAGTDPRDEPFSGPERTFVELVAQWVSYELARQRDEERLRQQNERLEEFASVVSHDLRNPINVIEGSLDLARETGDPEHFERAERAVDRMEALIDDLLALARQGETVGETEPVDLGEVAREAWGTVETSGGALRVEDETVLRADRGRLRQLLENLFRNAVEHAGPDPTVRVGSFPEGFYVEDDGPGIPEGDRDRVFEPGHTTTDEGTGFGLSIVKRIAEAHGWRVGITDGRDGGARFEFRVE